MAWDDLFIYKISKVTSAQMNAIIDKIKNIQAEDIVFADSEVGDASTNKHGYMCKFPGGSTFLRADGVWATPSAAGKLTRTSGGLTTNEIIDERCKNIQSSLHAIFLSNTGGWSSKIANSTTSHEWGLFLPENFAGERLIATPYFYMGTTPTTRDCIVTWNFSGVAFANGDSLDNNISETVSSTTILDASRVRRMIMGTPTNPFNLIGNPTGGNWCQIRVRRDGLDIDNDSIYLLGIKLTY